MKFDEALLLLMSVKCTKVAFFHYFALLASEVSAVLSLVVFSVVWSDWCCVRSNDNDRFHL